MFHLTDRRVKFKPETRKRLQRCAWSRFNFNEKEYRIALIGHEIGAIVDSGGRRLMVDLKKTTKLIHVIGPTRHKPASVLVAL